MMKPVIMISYWFPPEGNAGVYRPLRFVRHLPALDWKPYIVSVDTKTYERYDPQLLSLVPNQIEVIRVRNPDPWQVIQAKRGHYTQKMLSQPSAERPPPIARAEHPGLRSFMREIIRRVETWCYSPDMAMFWIGPAVVATVNLCLRNKSSVIWATGPPFSSFVVARRASDKTGVPYVLDFRTSWTLVDDGFDRRKPSWAKQRDRRTLFRLLKGARAVIFAYDTEAECFWRVYQEALEVSKIHIIPNGFEGIVEKFSMPDSDQFRILYTGTLSSYRYDTLLQALHSLKKSNPVLAGQLKFLFVGECVEELAQKAEELALSQIVETSGPTSQAEVIRLQRQAHALLMLERKPSVKGYELLAGAKLFGYLRAGRPILGVLPQGEAKKTLQRVGASTVADVDSPAEIVAVLQRLFDAWSGECLSSLIPDRTACSVYSAEYQTKALVRALEGVSAMTPFIPGSVEVPPSLQEDIAKWERFPNRI